MKDATLIALVVDRSGSINHCLGPMQSALDEFISLHKSEPGECELLLAQFDDIYEKVFQLPIAEVSGHQIVPRGTTALHDAIGRTILDVGASLKNRPESERPDKVIFCLITDGLENASREFTVNQVSKMVKHQTDKYSWDFLFLGANQNAILTAGQYNIPAHRALTYAATASGIRGASASLGRTTSALRSAPAASAGRRNLGFRRP